MISMNDDYFSLSLYVYVLYTQPLFSGIPTFQVCFGVYMAATGMRSETWPTSRLWFRTYPNLFSLKIYREHRKMVSGWWFGAFLFFHILGMIIPTD
jgi:hypothetical protein